MKHSMVFLKKDCNYPNIWYRYWAILGCAVVGSLGIFILDTLIFRFDLPYYSDDVYVLYPVAVRSLIEGRGNLTRPLEYLIVLAANNLYLPLWLGASLLCAVGATVLSALACERLFERRLPKAGWWVLGLANPLLFYLATQPDVVSQALCDLLFAAAMLAFITELYQLRDEASFGWRSDRLGVFLNFMAATLFFTKETALAASVIIPVATTLVRLEKRRLSFIFLSSLLLPIGAGICWIYVKLKFPVILPAIGNERYDVKLDPITWVQNLIVTLAFPITPLPSSFLEFGLLRQLWITAALGSVTLFTWILWREARRKPKIVVPLLVVVASCAPMILIHSSEYYSTMIAPLAISTILLFAVSKMRRLALAYGLLLYAASFGNGIIYCLRADFNLLGLQRLGYSIYGKEYQSNPICPIRTTAHVGWDGAAAGELPYVHAKGRITCIP